MLSHKEWIWENKLEKKTDFESENFNTGVSTNQLFSRLVSFWIEIFKLCENMNQQFYDASGFQIEIFSFKIKFCSKTRFKKIFCYFAPQKRQSSLFRAFLKRLVLKWKDFGKPIWIKISTKCQVCNQEIFFMSKFDLSFAKSVKFWINSFKMHQISKKVCFFNESGFDEIFAFGKRIL